MKGFSNRQLLPGADSASSLSAEAIGETLARAEACWRRGGGAAVGEAVRVCDDLLANLPRVAREQRAKIWLRRGQFLESVRTPGALAEAVRSQEAGLADLGSRDAGDADGAIEARLRALLWMNRGNALLALGSEEAAREAVRSYGMTLDLLAAEASCAGESASEAAERCATLGAAWLNQASALRIATTGETASAEEIRGLDQAIGALSLAAELGSRPARRNLAGAWLNRAGWCERVDDLEGARYAWENAIAAAAPEVARDPVALETGLRARHALCVQAGRKLAAGETLSEREAESVLSQIEDGLADFAKGAATRPSPAAPAVEELAERLFEFGAWFVRLRFPRRLTDYLSRHAEGGAPARRSCARLTVEMARQDILRLGFAELLSEPGREARASLAEFEALEARWSEDEKRCRENLDTK